MAFLFPEHSLPAVKVVHLNYNRIASCPPTEGIYLFIFTFSHQNLCRRKRLVLRASAGLLALPLLLPAFHPCFLVPFSSERTATSSL